MGTTAPVTVADWLDRQLQLHPADIELGLDRVRVVAARLGIERAARRQLVVAGTNGKGSSVAVLEALGRAHGWTTATYTSPHLVHYNERIRFDGEPVDDASLCAAFERVDAARGEVPLTYFEFGTLAALDLIRRAAVDLAVLEIGLGGRLDAVNIIDGDGALVTAIGLDHMEYLGPDRAAIGREKAGVFRAGQPAVCADVDAPATIAAVATEVGAAYRERGQDFDVGYGADGWVLNLGSVALDGLPWPVAGAQHAVDNAAGALALMDALGWLPGREAIDAAITARPAGRLQVLGAEPLQAVDVGHNPAAAAAICRWLDAQACDGRVHVVLAMLADKDPAGFVAGLEGSVDAWYAATTAGDRGLAGAMLAQRAGLVDATIHDDVASAWEAAIAAAGPADVVLAAGSFQAAGEILRRRVIIGALDGR